MTRIPFDVMELEVSKLFEENLYETNLEAINKQVKFIAQFIQACGWTEEEYLRQLFVSSDMPFKDN